jgi:hypothetical protein
MARKKLTSSTQSAITNQDAINQAADQVVDTITTSVLDRAEEKLMDFFLGGGFQTELAGRLNPILTEFTNSLGLPISGDGGSAVSLLGGDGDNRPVFDVEAQDVS